MMSTNNTPGNPIVETLLGISWNMEPQGVLGRGKVTAQSDPDIALIGLCLAWCIDHQAWVPWGRVQSSFLWKKNYVLFQSVNRGKTPIARNGQYNGQYVVGDAVQSKERWQSHGRVEPITLCARAVPIGFDFKGKTPIVQSGQCKNHCFG